jgi:hypothetical protein
MSLPITAVVRSKGEFTHSMPRPCRAAKGVECVFPIWFTQCGHVWFIKMWSVNHTRPHCVNQMGKTHSKPLAARHGRGTACYVWIRLKAYESAASRLLGLWVRTPLEGMDTSLLWVLCVLSGRGLLRRSDHLFWGFLLSVVCQRVISRPQQWGGLGPTGGGCRALTVC